jgi:phospho-N-acetylmuramoyl-pentapeptide-transferase
MWQEYFNYILLAFAVAALWAPIIISILYKFSLVIQHRLMQDESNAEFIKIHGHKSGTPRSGGLIIFIPVIVLSLIFIPQSTMRDIWLIGWTGLGLYGFADDLLTSTRKLNDKFRQLQETFVWRLGKLALLFFIICGLLALAYTYLGWTSISLFGLVTIPFESLALPGLAFLAAMAIYGVEITDGADGLVTGQFLIALVTYTVVVGMLGRAEFLPMLGLAMGTSIVYLYFNINPARVFMGGSGTMPIAFTLLFIAALTQTLGVVFIMGLVFWVELSSSFIQILSIRFLKRKFFRIAPLHHHFEAVGWPEAKVVQRFWLAATVAAVFALWLFALSIGA